MDELTAIVRDINSILWGPWCLIPILVGAGIFFTFKLRFVQIRQFGRAFRHVFGGFSLKGEKAGSHGMTSFQSLATAVAAQVGTGNLAGVATAIAMGGPGAIFWMWLAAFFGMSTIFAEAVLGQLYRTKDPQGHITGGPAYYISHEAGQGGGEDPEPNPDADLTALIISEYVEGSGNNKYLEIANISSSEIDLSAYTLRKYVNGAEDSFDDMALSGTLASKAVKVFQINSAALTLPEGVTAESTNSQVLNFNGDDPIAIICNGEVVDLLGVFGDVDFGKDVTLRRKSSVTAPSATYKVDEWDEFPKDDVSGLGTL